MACIRILVDLITCHQYLDMAETALVNKK